MLLYPAIDLMDGQVVRLQRGLASKKIIYSDHPVEIALKWQNAGADWLHLIDLDAAFEGKSRNLKVIQAIQEAVSIPCQLGGGMRDMQSIEMALLTGVSRVIIGTKATELKFLIQAASTFGSERLALGIDSKDGKVAVMGWVETLEKCALDLAQEAVSSGIHTIIYTDISTDGMMQGPNLIAMREMASHVVCNLIASGGVSCAEDLRELAAIPKIHGAIIGRALYEGRISPHNLRGILQ